MNDIREILQQSKNALEQYLELWNGNSKLIVIINGGIPIRCQSPRATFNQVIKMLEVEDVYNLNIGDRDSPLISEEPRGENQKYEIAPGRYIKTALSNYAKAQYLLEIAEGLDIELFIIDTDIRNGLIAAWRTRRHGKDINNELYEFQQVNSQ